MINVSDAFREELNNGNRVYLAYATITLTDGTKLSLTNEYIWANGVKIDDATSDSNVFSIGSAIAKKLTLTINNVNGDFSDYVFDGATVNIQLGLRLQNGTIEKVNKGNDYTVEEATGQNTSVVTLECLDSMAKFNKPYSAVTTAYPASLAMIIRDVCSYCGVAISTSVFPNSDYVVQNRPEDEALSCLDVISFVAQIACCWARVNGSGQLVLNWYDTKDIVATRDLVTKANKDRITTKSGDYIVVLSEATDEELREGSVVTKLHRIQHTGSHTVAMDDVVITGIRVTNKRGQETFTELYGSEGYVLGIEENPFVEEGMELTVASLVGERCIGMTFRPLSVTTLNDPTIEAGDRMYFISPIDNAVYKSYITSTTFAIDDWQNIACEAESPARKSATKFGSATKSYVALRDLVKKERTTREQALEELGTRIDNASGLYMTEEVQPDGSVIYYQHDKPTKEESTIIWKETAETRSVSTDGGKTWNAGITADGDAIVKILTAEGINADWINAGTLVIRDSNGNIVFSASKETATSGGSVYIGAKSVTIGGYNQVANQTISEALDSVKTNAHNELVSYSQTVTNQFAAMQAQLDGQIVSWYDNYDPTLSNLPASDWTTEALKEAHEGDTFTNTDTGQSWRFVKDSQTQEWLWKVIADTAAAAALLAAQEAQRTADNKIRNFVSVPEPPYDEGDIWMKSDGTLLTCITSRASGEQYSANDWQELVKYTDDTVANQALEEARNAKALNVILSNEYDSIPTDADGNYSSFPSGILTIVQTFLGHNDITNQCTYTVTVSSGLTGNWNLGTKTYTVTALTGDNGWVDITATYLNSLSATKRFTIAKVKQGIRGLQGDPGKKGDPGEKGDPGTAGRVYIVEPSAPVFSKSAMGDVLPDAIVYSAYYRDGDEARQAYEGRFKIEETVDGETWSTVYTSSKNETSCRYCPRYQLITKADGDLLKTKKDGHKLVGPHTNATAVRCTLYQAGGTVTVLDQQSTPFIEDTAGLTVILSNETVSVTADADGTILDYAECFTDIQVYYGNTDVTNLASYSTPVASAGLTGRFNGANKRYNVTNLTSDDGYVDFTITYKDVKVTRRFTISKSKNGISMVGTTELYALNNSSTTAPADSAFTEGIKTPTSSNRYLWNMEKINYSDDSSKAVDKHIVAIYGETGVGLQSVENYYAVNNLTTAPADSAFSTDVKTTTSTNKYLWNYEVSVYSDGTRHKTDKRIIGTYGDKGDKGDKGDSGRVYIVEPSSNVITKDAKGDVSPEAISFNAYYRDGSGNRVAYSGRFKIEESTDGSTWTTVYTSSQNETSCRYVLRHQLVTKSAKDPLVTKKAKYYIVGPHVSGTMFRCTLYEAGGTTVAQDTQTVPVVTHTTGLTVVLSNETVSVTAETDGTIPDYSECFTDVKAWYGNVDVTGLATYTCTKSSGLTGTWDATNKRYSVSALTVDDGYVDITVAYKGITVVRRFTISKSKDGVWVTRPVELYALNNDANTPPDDSAFTEGIKTPTATNRFMWNMERLVYSNGETMTLDKHLVAMYGETGVGLKNVVEYYALTQSTATPADNAFSTTVQTPTAVNKYLWNYEVVQYDDGSEKKTDKHIIGIYGDKGDSATRYYLEFTSKVLKIGKDGVYLPTSITVSLRQVTGNTGVASYFKGRLKIVEWKDSTQKVIRNNTAAAVETFTYTPSEKNIDRIKFEMYNYVNGSYNLLDQETVQCMIDFNALSQEDVFNVLTNNGDWQGIYKEAGSGKYYLNFTFAKAGTIVLGGLKNENGTLEIRDAEDKVVITADNTGININKGSFTIKDSNKNVVFQVATDGTLTATKGTIADIHISGKKLYSGEKSSYDSTKSGFCLDGDGYFGLGNQYSYITWDGTNLKTKGKIYADEGEIAGIKIDQNGFHTTGKTSYSDDTAGFYLDSNGYFGIGDDEHYLTWSGSELNLSGNITVGGANDSYGSITVLGSGGKQIASIDQNGLIVSTEDKTFGTEIVQIVGSTIKGVWNNTTWGELELVGQYSESSSATIKIKNNAGSIQILPLSTSEVIIGGKETRVNGLLHAVNNIEVAGNITMVTYGTTRRGKLSVYEAEFDGGVVFNNPSGSSTSNNTVTFNSDVVFNGSVSGNTVPAKIYGGKYFYGTVDFWGERVDFHDDVYFTNATVHGITAEVPSTISQEMTFTGKVNVQNELNAQRKVRMSGLESSSSGTQLILDSNYVKKQSSSSVRYKTIKRDMSETDIEKLYNIQPVMAKYKKGYLGKEDERYGKYFPMFIAEDVEEYLPDAVDHIDGKPENWNYRIMIPAMFQMLKSQKEEIDKLKKQLNTH